MDPHDPHDPPHTLPSLRLAKLRLYEVTMVFLIPRGMWRAHCPMHGPHALASTVPQGRDTESELFPGTALEYPNKLVASRSLARTLSPLLAQPPAISTSKPLRSSNEEAATQASVVELRRERPGGCPTVAPASSKVVTKPSLRMLTCTAREPGVT